MATAIVISIAIQHVKELMCVLMAQSHHRLWTDHTIYEVSVASAILDEQAVMIVYDRLCTSVMFADALYFFGHYSSSI